MISVLPGKPPMTARSILLLILLVSCGCFESSLPNTQAPKAEPSFEPPAGLDEFSKTGVLPVELTLLVDDKGRNVVMPCPTGESPAFNVSKRANNAGYVLTLNTKQLGDVSNPNYSFGENSFAPKNGETIPIFGELYSVAYLENGLKITRVSNSVSERIFPGKTTRTISTADKEPSLFFSASGTRSEFYQLNILSFDSDLNTADIELIPFVDDTSNSGPPTIKKRRATVTKGQPLLANGQSLLVVNIVPPQVIGEQRLAGWIEFDRIQN